MKLFSNARKSSDSNGKKQDFKKRLTLHLAALLVLLFAFATTIMALFPEDALRERTEKFIHTEMGSRISIEDLSLSPPLSIRMKGITWHHGHENLPSLHIPAVDLAPEWRTLFSSNLGASIDAHLVSGVLDGYIRRDGTFRSTIVDTEISTYFPQDFGYRPQGELNGRIEASGPLLSDEGEANFEFQLAESAISGLEKLGASQSRLELGRINLTGTMKGRNLKIESINNEGGDFQIEGKATLLVANEPHLSRISAQFEITPGPGLDPALKDLLSISGVKPDRTGTFHFRLTGTLANPSLR